MDEGQITIFPGRAEPDAQLPPLLSADTSLKAAIGAFKKHMQYEGFSPHTVQAFTSDLNLLAGYLGAGQPIGAVTTQSLNDFLKWMLHERDAPCSPKTYARRVTTVKVFFKWLFKGGILTADPSAPVIQRSVRSPLPAVLNEDQVQRLVQAADQAYRGESLTGAASDARPLLLVQLLLQTGVKKGEAMGIVPNHIDRADPDNPILFVRYGSPAKRYKERKIPLDPAWLPILDDYVQQYNPPDTLFTCTPRNLEYILRDMEEAAAIDKPVSFECLRWTSAVQSYMDGADTNELRERMGLSEITWRETLSKIQRLAAELTRD